MTTVDRDVVSRIAHLAALDVAPEDLAPVAGDLGAIVSWVDALSALPDDDDLPATGPSLALRPDRVEPAESELLAVAPEVREGRYRVPAVLKR